MSEIIRDRVREQIIWILSKPSQGDNEPSMLELADQILSIPGLAVVDRKAELSYYCWHELKRSITEGEAKGILLKAGWVKEIKE